MAQIISKIFDAILANVKLTLVASAGHSTKHGLDWTVGLDSWTGQLDWTIGLDYWTGFRMGFFPLNRRNLTDSKVYGMFLRKTK